MNRMIVLFLPALLTGCWPYIGDDWETEATRGIVEVARTDYLGTYWGEDGGPTVDAGAIVLAQPQEFTWRQYYVAAGEGCQWGPTPLEGGFAVDDPGAPSLILRGPGTITMTWDASQRVYSGAANVGDWHWNASYDLDSVSTDYGTIGWAGALQTPNSLTVSQPNLGGAELSTFTVEGLEVVWNEVGADYYLVEVTLVSAAGNAYEVSNCITEGTQLRLARSQFSDLGRASYAVISVSAVRTGAEVMPNWDAMMRFDAKHRVVGAFVPN